jgi:hypothetical protein
MERDWWLRKQDEQVFGGMMKIRDGAEAGG